MLRLTLESKILLNSLPLTQTAYLSYYIKTTLLYLLREILRYLIHLQIQQVQNISARISLWFWSVSNNTLYCTIHLSFYNLDFFSLELYGTVDSYPDIISMNSKHLIWWWFTSSVKWAGSFLPWWHFDHWISKLQLQWDCHTESVQILDVPASLDSLNYITF